MSTCLRCFVICIGREFPQRIEVRLAVIVYRYLSNTARQYLACHLQHVVDISSRRQLRSALSSSLCVPRTNLSTIGDRSFPVAAANVCNNLPPSVRSLPSFILLQYLSLLHPLKTKRSAAILCQLNVLVDDDDNENRWWWQWKTFRQSNQLWKPKNLTFCKVAYDLTLRAGVMSLRLLQYIQDGLNT